MLVALKVIQIMINNQFELQIDARLENLSVIADFVAESMRQLGIEERKSLYEVQTAVDEACTNVIKYAYSGEEGIITISCEQQDNDLVITISDKGKSFDPTTVPLPDLEANWEERKIGGLGIYLIKQLMDKVSYSFDAEKGNILIMRREMNETKRKP